MPTYRMTEWMFVHETMTTSLMLSLVPSRGTVHDSWAVEHTLQLSACLQQYNLLHYIKVCKLKRFTV